MDEAGDFMTTLRAFMRKAHRRAPDLAKLTGISVRTIENWCAGVVQRPREITDVINIARALGLNATDATTLLIAASYDPLTTLWSQAQRADDTKLLDLLATWSPELERMADSVEDIPVTIPAIDRQNATTSNDTPTPPLLPVPAALTIATSKIPADSSLQTWHYAAGSGVAAVAISADGEMVVAGTLGKTVCCLDGKGHPRWQMRVGNQAWRVALSVDGQATVVGTGSTRPWDLGGRGLYCFAADGSQRWRVDLDASIWGLALAADGNTIAAGTDKKQLLLFDGQGQRLWQHDVPGIGWYAWVWSTALSADGSLVVSGAADQRVRLFARTGALLGEHRTLGDVFAVAIAGDGTTVAAGDNKQHIYLLDGQGHLLWEELLADKVWAVVLSADGSRLLVGAGEKERHLRMYDPAGRLLWRRYVGGSVSSVALSQDGQQTSAGTRDGGIFIFGADGAVVHQARADKSVRDVALSATGEHMVAGSEDGKVYGFRLLRFVPATMSPMIDTPSSQAELTELDRASQTATLLWPAGLPDDRYYPLPGRERELGTLLDVLHDPHGAPVLVIDGLGGMGKTALAVELARRALGSGYFVGVVGDSAKQDLFIGGDIVRIREATLDFDSLLDAIARQLGRWELPTLNADEKRAALGQLLQRQRYLIVVDNLETTEDAQALVAQLRGYLSNGRAIVTSREQVRHDFVRSLSLPGLALEDSLFFLRADAAQRSVPQIIEAPEARLVEIHTITGGAPLALKLVVAQAQFLDLELVLRRLRPAGSKLYPFIFQQSWEALSPEAQRMLIYIGRTVVTTVGWEELRAVGIAESDDTLVVAIDQLAAYSLLNVIAVGGQMRYSIHQLTHQFVESDLPALWREQGLI